MKFRQHIRVYGYPDALKVKIPIKQAAKLVLEGVGDVNLYSVEKFNKFKKLMDEHGIKYKDAPKDEMTRIRYLCMNAPGGIGKSIRGRKYKGDILYTVEADDERELLDKRDAAIEELKTLKVHYEDVCKWVCETAPKLKTENMFKKGSQKKTPVLKEIAEEHKKLKNTVADIQEKIFDFDKKTLKKAAEEDIRVRKGILQ